MRPNASPARLLLTLLLLAGLFFSTAGVTMARMEEAAKPASIPPQTEEPVQKENAVNPAPRQAVDELNIVISEFRFTGPEGGSDEFIELFNPSGRPININGWKIMGANNSGSDGTERKTITYALDLQPGQHYLLAFKDASASLLALADATYNTGTTDDGGIALTLSDGITIIDQVGLSAGTVYKEGTPLAPLAGTANQSYERKTSAASPFNCNDTDNNFGDFLRNSSSSNPQNSNAAPIPCFAITNVTSTANDAPYAYATGETISIQVSFIYDVDVTGTPTLLLETGLVDGQATYVAGSGTKTITFEYTVKDGDTSSDLDYVSTTALSLNGGSITGAIGNAILLLPKPGDIGSLSANKNIRIDTTTDTPSLVSFKRQNPLTSPTNQDTLTFRATFSQAVVNVSSDGSDFEVSANPALSASPTIAVTRISSSVYDVKISGTSLNDYDGEIGLNLRPGQDINDVSGTQNLPLGEPPIDEIYEVDNTPPSVNQITQVTADNVKLGPLEFTVEFDDPINPATFTSSDVTQAVVGGPLVSWSVSDSGDHQNFTLLAYPSGNGDVAPSIPQNRVADVAGNLNTVAYVPTYANCADPGNDCIVLDDDIRPTVTIAQAATQSDPTTTLPIRFDVQFSEPINTYSFTSSDITQESGAATSVTWSITNPSGDKKNFIISATASGYGTLKPIIEANRVLDLVGNSNTATDPSANDNEVEYRRALSVTIEQAAEQRDPIVELPIEFTVKFSRKIKTDTFTVDDITQTGTAANVTWRIINSGDDTTFTLSARNTDSYGTLIPVIFANQVTDFEGLFQNTTSTSTDGTVNYIQEGAPKTVVISEVAWAGTAASSSDEWIELYNTTSETIHLDGWVLRSFRYNGEDFYVNLNIQLQGDISPRTSEDPGDMSGFFLLETRENAVSNITADQLYTGSLYNSGEILVLCSPYNLQPNSPAPCNINVKNKLVDFVNGSLTSTGNIKPWPAGSSSTYGSMERKSPISDEETNYYTHTGLPPRFGLDANGAAIKGTPKHSNWAKTVTATPRATATPTRTPTPRPSAAPILVINEVLARAGTDWNNDGVVDVYDEFIEVINAGTVNVSLSGYKLDDEKDLGSAPFTLPSGTLKPGEKMVFYGSQTGILLDDSGDTVRLLKASNNSVVDAVTYTMVKSLDFSVCRYTDGYGSWIVGCFPTPGRPNQLTGDRVPPTSGGQPIPVCVLPDSVPLEFVLAECEESGLGIWNPFYWDGSPGETNELWQSDEHDKWPVLYE